MIGKKINQLATELAPVSTDLTIIGDPDSGVSKKITLAQLGAIFSGAVSFYTDLVSFPATGDINVIYCAKDTQKLYLWSGSAYVEVFPSQSLLDTYQLRSEKGNANGYASLDSGGKVPISQLPSSIMEYKGTWNASTNTPTLANGTGDTGDVYICNVAGTVNFGAGPLTFAVGDYVIYSGSIWQRSSGAVGTVTSVALTVGGDAISVSGSPLTTSGTLALAFSGTTSQYIRGNGTLANFPTSLVTGSGTTNFVSKFTTSSTIGSSQIWDNGTSVLIGTTGSLPGIKVGIYSSTQRALEVISTNANALFVQSPAAFIMSISNGTWITQFTNTGRLDLAGDLLVNTIANATTDTDRFLVSDSGVIKYRTGAELLSDIGGASASGYVPYTGATANVDLGTHTLIAAKGTFSSSGSGDTVGITHSSGSGIALNITKGGNGEGLYINKTSGSGNAATIIGTLNATTLVKSGGTSSQYLMADGSTSTLTNPITGTGTSGQIAYFNGTNSITSESNLFWDSTNDRLGVGTNAPTSRISVFSESGDAIISSTFFTNVATDSGANIVRHARGTISSPTALQSGDVLGAFIFSGYNGSIFTNPIAIRGFAAENYSAGSTGGFFGFETTASGGIVRTEKLRILGNGNVIIQNGGTFTDAGFRLDVNGTFRQTGSTTAASAIARGSFISPTLVAAANNDVLVGLDINPTFTNGAFTGVSNIVLRLTNTAGSIGLSPVSYSNVGSSNELSLNFGNTNLSAAAQLSSNRLRTGSAFNNRVILTTPNVAASNAAYLFGIDGFQYNVGMLYDRDNGWLSLLNGTGTNNTTYTSRLYVHSTGNVTINTATDAGFRLDVNGTARISGQLTANNFVPTSSVVPTNGMYSPATNTLGFATNSTLALSITSGGEVGIGTTSPATKLDVISNSNSFQMARFENSNNTSGNGVLVTSLGSNCNNISSYHLIAATGGADKFYLYGNGVFATVSDIRLKKNIKSVEDKYLEKVLALDVVNYNWNDQQEGNSLELGLIAQQVEKSLPFIINENRPDKDGNIFKSIQVSALPYILIKAIQEQQAQIEQLKNK
jgi:hypothetical protein